MIELGSKCRDVVTGFEGIATSRTQYLTGCDRYSLTPPAKDAREYTKPEYFDENSLEVIGPAISLPGIKAEVPPLRSVVGGPQRDDPPR